MYTYPLLSQLCQRLGYIIILSLTFLGQAAVWSQSAVFASSPRPSVQQSNDFQFILLQFKEHLSENESKALIERIDGELVTWFPQINLAKVRISNHMTIEEIRHHVSRTEGNDIEQIEKDGFLFGTQTLLEEVNDPDLFDGDKVYAPQAIQATDAWSITMGKPEIIIAILDTGLHMTHPEFSGRITDGYDFVNGDSDPSDDHGHGTYVSGIVGMAINNGEGSVGICPQCHIMPVKVLDQTNRGSWSNVAAGILYAVDHGARIINLSLGTTENPNAIRAAIDYATAQKVLVIAAVGNNSSNEPFYPAAFVDVMGVSATNQDSSQWVDSNYGDYIDIAAPGADIYSTYHEINGEGIAYDTMSGTSAAAPHVAGLAGLLLSQDSERCPDEIRTIITTSACDLGVVGVDPIYGAGFINAYAALSRIDVESKDTIVKCPNDPNIIESLELKNILFLPKIMGN